MAAEEPVRRTTQPIGRRETRQRQPGGSDPDSAGPRHVTRLPPAGPVLTVRRRRRGAAGRMKVAMNAALAAAGT